MDSLEKKRKGKEDIQPSKKEKKIIENKRFFFMCGKKIRNKIKIFKYIWFFLKMKMYKCVCFCMNQKIHLFACLFLN